MNIFSLFATLNLDAGGYLSTIDQANAKGEEFAEHTEKKVSPKAIAGWMAVIAVIVKVVQAVIQLTQQSMQFADQTGELANKYGVATESIGEMQYMATQTGTTIERLTTGMSMLYMRAKSDGEAFKQLGVSVKDVNGNFKSMDDLFYETIGALNTLEDDGAKSSYMLDLFGRSAMEMGEILRKDTDEINAMRKEAHDLGIVLSEQTTDFAGEWFDRVDKLKLQGQSVLASMVAGAPDAEERFDKLMDTLLETTDKYLPAFVKFFVKLITVVGNELMSIAPTIIADIVAVAIEVILDTNWFVVGTNIGLSIVEGIANVWVTVLNKLFGTKHQKVNLGIDEKYYQKDTMIDLGSEYEISENINQTIEVKVEASGDSSVSEETAEKTAEALAPYIDKILGGK